MRTAFLYRRDAAPLDAITQGSGELAKAVGEASGFECPVLQIGPSGVLRDGRNCTRVVLSSLDLLVLEYNPFSYGRWGFAPWLPVQWARLRAARTRPRLAIRLHEMYVPMEDWRTALMGTWQRAQLVPLAAGADLIYAVTNRWTEEFVGPTARFRHLPVSSNLPDRRDAREEIRQRLGIPDDAVAVVAFGAGHPSRDNTHLIGALERIRAAQPDAVVLNLGQGGPRSGLGSAGLRTITPGEQSSEDVSAHLAAGDVFLSPLVDGVSTRRGTVMAALQHRLAVVTTDGPATDAMLREVNGEALVLTPAGDAASFAAAAAELARDPRRAGAVGANGRELFDRRFAWPVVARSLLDLASEVPKP